MIGNALHSNYSSMLKIDEELILFKDFTNICNI